MVFEMELFLHGLGEATSQFLNEVVCEVEGVRTKLRHKASTSLSFGDSWREKKFLMASIVGLGGCDVWCF